MRVHWMATPAPKSFVNPNSTMDWVRRHDEYDA